ncbi:transporter substrate-binding domain-containing protein [Arthrobacter sp. DNA4]|uniref:transporter substrate-binding domain-containing protein n=1 Tax=Micrococcaceae TaxID=1268 RepID=UPI0020CE73BE|nr:MULTISPECIES: transporter substrate-binding domain-containing protein [Micrococcaceae]UTT69385.1 transporter substrate-binding domain-containing protein [Arthrobacter sp. DNA4]WRT13682.1 transporter substrate-binding domain-containing protein [Pseudarthrobacter sp. LT1]
MAFPTSGRRRAPAARPAVVLLGTALLGSAALAGCADPGASAAGNPSGGAQTTAARNGVVYNTSPDQQRIRAEKDPALAAKVPELIGKDGKLSVATTAGSIPLSFHATDDKTPIGSELDIAQLVADKLGLQLDVQVTSWENWPLKTQSGDFEAVFSNVGVNKDRVKLFDFASYRAAYMGFEAKKSSTYDIKGADDISGLKISVGSGTNQEKILLAWNKELEAKGKAPATLQYYSSDADTILALSSGRTDLNIAPYPSTVYRENTRDDLKVVGKVNAGWPSETLVAATTLRGNGLAPVISEALNEVIQDGSYGKVLERWGLSEEALPESKTITAENFAATPATATAAPTGKDQK